MRDKPARRDAQACPGEAATRQAGESQANRRSVYFANKADIEDQNDVAALFRSTAEGETGHAHGHLPVSHAYTDMYPGLAKQARDEDLGRENDEKTSAVHFLRFEFSKPMAEAIRAGAAVMLGCDHRNCPAHLPIAADTLTSLAGDLR